MPKNLFGNMKPSALLAMMQQEQQPPAYKSANPFGQAQTQPPVQQDQPIQVPSGPPIGHTSANPFAPPLGDTRNAPNRLIKALDPKAQYFTKESMEDRPPSGPPEDARKLLLAAGQGEMHEGPPAGYGEPKLSAMDQYINDQFAAKQGVGGPNFGGNFDLSKLGAAAAEMEKAKLARRAEFESTPELDKLIAATQGQLDQTKSERKKPGLGEFLTLALMNLGNRDHRNNADMVLGTGEQREKEQRLEALLNHYQGSKASAQMQGRREMHSTDQQNRYRDLQMAMKKAEMKQKQSNEDREFQFKGNQAGINLLRQLAGQDAQIQGASMDEKTRKDAAKSRAALLKAMGADAGGIENMIRQQQLQKQKEAEAKDERQGRLFGDFIGGGGYA